MPKKNVFQMHHRLS